MNGVSLRRIPTSTSFMISSGSSLRGLSLVRMTRSLPSPPLAHQRTLPPVTISATSEYRNHAIRVQPRATATHSAARHPCGNNPPPPQTAARIHALKSARHPGACRDSAHDLFRRNLVTDCQRSIAARMLYTLISPDQRLSNFERAVFRTVSSNRNPLKCRFNVPGAHDRFTAEPVTEQLASVVPSRELAARIHRPH